MTLVKTFAQKFKKQGVELKLHFNVPRPVLFIYNSILQSYITISPCSNHDALLYLATFLRLITKINATNAIAAEK
ncbi:hypothetical protein SCO01_00120 [Staphylococcus cohnii subsp. cohnii]|nr:hypothetical protein SCO01_00120 [Staphylococcus cohnii subsp. cohnii]